MVWFVVTTRLVWHKITNILVLIAQGYNNIVYFWFQFNTCTYGGSDQLFKMGEDLKDPRLYKIN